MLLVIALAISVRKDSQKTHRDYLQLIKNYNQTQLIDIARNISTTYSSSKNNRIFACAALIDIAPEKALIVILELIKVEFDTDNLANPFLKMLKYFPSHDDQKFIYDFLFEDILQIQDTHFTSVTYHSSSESSFVYSTTGTYGTRYVLDNLSKILNFKSRKDLIRYNFCRAFQKIISSLQPDEPVDLEKIARLCRTPKILTIGILEHILQQAPTIGKYQEFEMTFTPTKHIFEFDLLIDIDAIAWNRE